MKGDGVICQYKVYTTRVVDTLETYFFFQIM